MSAKQWEEEVRRGALQAFTYFRRRLQAEDDPLDSDTRDGLIDLLNYTEEHLVEVWKLIEMSEQTTLRGQTRAVSAKIARGRRA